MPAALALGDAPKNPAAPAPPAADMADPPGTTLYMDQLRALFAAWDLDGDNNLDKAELAKAFRGADAKPYEGKKPPDAPADLKSAKKTDSEYPDYDFLVQLDQDGDGQISRDEFMTWARDHAVQMKAQADEEAKLAAMEAKLANGTTSKELKALERELKKERQEYAKLQSQTDEADRRLREGDGASPQASQVNAARPFPAAQETSLKRKRRFSPNPSLVSLFHDAT